MLLSLSRLFYLDCYFIAIIFEANKRYCSANLVDRVGSVSSEAKRLTAYERWHSRYFTSYIIYPS